MNAAEDYPSETSQTELASGVLKQARQDLHRFRGATSAVDRELYLDAYSWLTSDDTAWPFSFLNVCQLLNLAPETVREDVLGDLSFGAFGYWNRRTGRGARRFKMLLRNIFTHEPTANAAQTVT